MATLCFYAQFIDSAVGADGLTVTWDVEQITRSTGARAALVTGGATNITIGRNGLYGYYLSGADLTIYDYIATAITSGTADQKEIAALWSHFAVEAEETLVADVATVDGKVDVVDGNVDTILGQTGTSGVVLADDSISASTFDETTAFPQTTEDIEAMVLP